MMKSDVTRSSRCGYIAIIGRPNVGKSTLLNFILGQKLSITSRKPQTTRHRLLGIKTTRHSQFLYVDTPGMHAAEKRAINRYMNRSARSVARDVDVIVLVTDRTAWQDNDKVAADSIKGGSAHVVVAVNKVDLLANKELVLPQLEKLQHHFPQADIIPISAEKGENISALEDLVEKRLPHGDFLFAHDQLTDRSERFLVSEIIREKIMRQLGEELPYAVTIQIESFESRGKTTHIDAVIFVERKGQKAILIGKAGDKLRRIGTDSRHDIELLLARKVMLGLWVKVKSGWSDDDRALKSLGYDDL